jgi:hypothetical protein
MANSRTSRNRESWPEEAKGHGQMKTLGMFAALALAISIATTSAEAKGCMTGALAGAVAGHYAHHTVTGAIAGCYMGHHIAKYRRQQQEPPAQSKEPSGGSY